MPSPQELINFSSLCSSANFASCSAFAAASAAAFSAAAFSAASFFASSIAAAAFSAASLSLISCSACSFCSSKNELSARIVPIISISSVPAERENDKVLDVSSLISSNSISSPSDKIKKSSSEYPILASKKSL